MKFFRIFTNSVATRTTLLILLFMAAVMIASGIFQTSHVRAVVAEEVNRQAGRSMEGAITVIENRVSNVETAVNTAASYADMFAPNENKIDSLLYRLIESNQDISAVTLLYKENYFPRHGRYFAPTVLRDDVSGELVKDQIGGPEYDFCYLETDSNWIYTNLHDDGYWCLPYLDSMSTKRQMITYSVPIHDKKDSIYAVLCADVDLHWVRRIIDEAKPYPYCEAFVLSRDSQFVYHPDPEFITSVNAVRQAQTYSGDDYLQLTQRMLGRGKGVDTIDDPFPTLGGNKAQANLGNLTVFYAPVSRVLWSVCFTIPHAKIMERPDQLRAQMLLLLGCVILVISILLYLTIRIQLAPLTKLAQSTKKVAKGQFDVTLPKINTHDEIRRLRDSFDDMQHSLAKYVNDLEAATSSKAKIESELQVASTIQMSMIPKTFPPFPERRDLDVFATLTPAKEVGGDLYDFYIRDEKLFFCIGDVSGKGVPAALVMAVVRAQFRAFSAHESRPDYIVGAINNMLATDNDSNMFVTLFVGVLDLPTGRLRYTNAGHDAPLLLGATVGTLPCESNLPIGVFVDFKYVPQDAVIDPQTTILLFTDGLTEAEDRQHRQYTETRIMETIHANTDFRPKEVINRMLVSVREFVDGAEQSDDLTMLGIQYLKEQLDYKFQQSIVVQNDVQQVGKLAELVESVCDKYNYDPAVTMQLNLALEEAVVNVMNYAYPIGTKGDINISAKADDTNLYFIIMDKGVPFDPTTKAEVDTTLSAEERPIGGLGIHLVRKLMDSINYERLDGFNILTLTKSLPSE